MDKFINLLVSATLFEMMVAIGMGVTVREVATVARNARLVVRAVVANYIFVPGIAFLLLVMFHAQPMVAAGFLLVAVCPGAPYGPPFTAIAKGNLAASVGLMVILASSSAVLAPLLLVVLLPRLTGSADLQVNGPRMLITLFVTQLLPLAIGAIVRRRRPEMAARWMGPAKRLSTVLNLALFALIIAVQYRLLLQIPLRGLFGMTLLVTFALLAGWVAGGRASADRKAMAVTTATRNVAVALVIATASFPRTTAISTVLVYAVFQTILIALVAWGAGRFSGSRPQRSLSAAA